MRRHAWRFVLTTKDKATQTLRGHRQMLTLSLPPDLVVQVDGEAAKQHRSRANMLEVILRERYGRVVAPAMSDGPGKHGKDVS